MKTVGVRWLGSVLILGVTACSPPAMVPTEGATCRSDGAPACDAHQPSLLVCTDATWVLISDCHGPTRCTQRGASVECDTSGNSVDDRCPPSSEGKVRCDPDGGTAILRCVSGRLRVDQTCLEPAQCVLADGGLQCL